MSVQDAITRWCTEADRTTSDLYRARRIECKFGNADLDEVQREDFLGWLKSMDISAATRNRYIAILRGSINMAADGGYAIPEWKLKQYKEDNKRIKWATKQQWEALQKELTGHMLCMARLAVFSGLRYSNVAELRVDQVDFTRQVAWVEAEDSKNGKALGVALNDDAMAAINDALAYGAAPGNFVFDAREFTYRKWHEACERAGLVNFRFHDLRHTWAAWHVMSGTRLEVLQQLGGWKTLQMVQRYAHLAPDYLKVAASNVRPIDLRSELCN